MSAFYCEMADRANQQGWRLVVFDPGQDLRHAHVRGWTPTDPAAPRGAWRQMDVPWPAAIYDNTFVHLAVHGYTRALREQAQERGVPLFNPLLPGKWVMHRWLTASTVREYLPPTVRVTSQQILLDALDTWSDVYIKPIGGYGGMGVTRVSRTGDHCRVRVDRTRRGGRREYELTPSALSRWAHRYAHGRHIVQRALPLWRLDGRTVDFRVVVMRGLAGRWRVIGVIPKRAATGGVVTNLVAGGERLSLDYVVQRAEREGFRLPLEELTSVALQAAEAVARHRPRTGVLGMDMGVTEDGGVWLIEVNPKPARSLLTPSMRQRAAQCATEWLVELASRHRR